VSPSLDALRRACRIPEGRASALFLAFLVLLALAGPALLPDPFRQFDIVHQASLPPSTEHPFGTDGLSRDVLARSGSGVQACVSCGLPLSATARFCRRCGSRQG
jgi:peptide/nickel transport system permease protein